MITSAKRFLLALVALFFTSVIPAQTWVTHQDNEKIHTIFYQGMGCSQTQCAKYCGSKGMVATTGERVVCPGSIELIYKPFIGVEIDEVALKKRISLPWYRPDTWMVKLQEVGCAIVSNKVYHYQIEQEGDESDETVAAHSLDIKKINIGQEGDVASHKKKVDAYEARYPDVPKILFGTSRGAATTFNAFAKHHYANVKLVVLEGCFDSVEPVTQMRTATFFQKLGVHSVKHWLLEHVTAYKRDSISPINSVETFPVGVPIVFITSLVDSAVPKECTQNLVNKCVARGKNEVYFFVLQHAGHSSYAVGESEDQKNYRAFMHALYKKYNLPYIAEYAQQGQELLKRARLK